MTPPHNFAEVERALMRFRHVEAILHDVQTFMTAYHDGFTPTQMDLWTRVLHTTVLFMADLVDHPSSTSPPSPVE